MIIGTNHIVWHAFVGISRSQGCKKNTCQKERIKGQNWARKGKEKTPLDEPTVPQLQASVQSSDELVHRVNSRYRRMNRRSIFYMRRTSCRGRVAKTVALDDPTVWVWRPSIYLMLSLNSYRDAPRRSLQHMMIWRLSQDEASVYPTVEWKLTKAAWARSLQHQMIRRTVGALRRSSCVREPQRLRDVGGAPDEPTPWKSIPSDHPMVLLSAAFSQLLVWCLGLFIPPPLTHLRLLDFVEVQRSSRHIEDHIQSIQVLNCSSLDMHMLCVCA
jgi:hypothetical protein